jgi:hypothetical protein
MKAGRASGISESKRHANQILAFQVNDIPGQLFGDCEMAGNLAGEAWIPKRSERLWRCLLAHNLNHIRPRDETGTWKSFQNCIGAKEMIAVAMGGVDRRQILSTRRNPIRQGSRLLDGNRGIDQHSVPLPRDKG